MNIFRIEFNSAHYGSIGMGYILEKEQFEVIERGVKDLLINRRGIFSLLNKRGQVIDLEEDIEIYNFKYSLELENGEIGIKSKPINLYGIKIKKVALVKMFLKINKELLDRWDSNGRREATVLHDLKIQNDIRRFLDQIEQFILRGVDTKFEFNVNDIGKEEIFNCFFHGHDKQSPINLYDFRELHEAVIELASDLKKEHYNPPFTLMSDSETLKWAKYKYFETLEGIITFKKRIEEKREIDKWINLYDNADNSKGDDYSLVCVAHNEQFKNTFKIIEKSPLNIVPVNGGIIFYWCGALETSENAIQQIRINNINT